MHIELHDLGAAPGTLVLDLEAYRDPAFGIPRRHGQVAVGEGGVRQAKAEGEQGLDLARVVPAVADQDTFLVRDHPARAREIAEPRLVREALREGHRQLARRADVAKQDIHQRRAGLLSWKPGVEHSGHLVEPGHDHGGAGGGDDDHLGIGGGRRAHDLVLPAGQRQRCPIRALGLVGHAVAHRHDHDVGAARDRGDLAQRILVGPLPEQLDRGADGAFVVFQAQIVRLAGDQLDLAGLEGRGVVAPVVDDQLAVEVEAGAVVGTEREHVEARLGWRKLAGPARREVILGQAGRGAGELPVEIHRGIETNQLGRAGSLLADEVFAK